MNLVVVDRHRLNGKIGSCLVHDLIRDVCLRKSEEDGFFCVRRALGIERERRIICHDFMPSDNTPKIYVVSKLLRVLNMAHSSLEDMSKKLNLRFLTYPASDTYSWSFRIPSSVSLIWNLQTLAINVHHIDAPVEIWNMQQLRHVKCYEIYIRKPPRNVQLVVLENLQTLTTPMNLRLSEEVCKRIPNVNKLYVVSKSDAPGFNYRWPDHLHNVGSLHKLRSLKLDSNFKGSSFCAGWRKCTFPTSLKKLKLINCRLHWNDLTRISSLPHLEVLKLHNSGKRRNWSPADGEFRTLKVLSIVNCDLRCWNADSSHFPILEKLFLERLRHLEEIPLDIGEIPTLELIDVYECSKSAHIWAEKIKEEQEVEQGNEGLRIQIQE